MREPFVFVETEFAEAERAAEKVRLQRRSVMSLRFDDPVLPYARAVLCHMEQNATLAALSHAISEL